MQPRPLGKGQFVCCGWSGDGGDLRAVGDCTGGVNAVRGRCEAAADSVLAVAELADGSCSGSGAGCGQTKAACVRAGDEGIGGCHEGCCGEDCCLHDGGGRVECAANGMKNVGPR